MQVWKIVISSFRTFISKKINSYEEQTEGQRAELAAAHMVHIHVEQREVQAAHRHQAADEYFFNAESQADVAGQQNSYELSAAQKHPLLELVVLLVHKVEVDAVVDAEGQKPDEAHRRHLFP